MPDNALPPLVGRSSCSRFSATTTCGQKGAADTMSQHCLQRQLQINSRRPSPVQKPSQENPNIYNQFFSIKNITLFSLAKLLEIIFLLKLLSNQIPIAYNVKNLLKKFLIISEIVCYLENINLSAAYQNIFVKNIFRFCWKFNKPEWRG